MDRENAIKSMMEILEKASLDEIKNLIEFAKSYIK